MRLIGLAVVLAVSLVLAPLAAEAQPAGKPWRIGYIGTVYTRSHDAFSEGLREFGYVEGRNIILERRFSEGKAERFPEFAAEMVRLKADVIVVATTPAAIAAKNATKTIPIVFPTAIDPVGAGVVTSLARHGSNVTGISRLSSDLEGKRLEFLKQAVPMLSRVAVLWNAANPANASAWRETQEAARALALVLRSHDVGGSTDFESAFAVMAQERPDALFVLEDGLISRHRRPIVDFATRKRLATMFSAREVVEAGGLMSYGPSTRELFRRAAYYVDKILKGAKPADLPFEQPTKFELVINMKTAKALGLTIPQTILLRADQVIE